MKKKFISAGENKKDSFNGNTTVTAGKRKSYVLKHVGKLGIDIVDKYLENWLLIQNKQ